MLSQATQTPVVSVNLSISRTVLMRPGDCSGISSPQTGAGADLRPRFRCKLLLLGADLCGARLRLDRKSTRLNSSHSQISYAVFCLKKKKHKKVESSLDIDVMTV